MVDRSDLNLLDRGDTVKGRLGYNNYNNGSESPDWITPPDSEIVVYVQKDRRGNVVIIVPVNVNGEKIENAEYTLYDCVEHDEGLMFTSEEYLFLITEI